MLLLANETSINNILRSKASEIIIGITRASFLPGRVMCAMQRHKLELPSMRNHHTTPNPTGAWGLPMRNRRTPLNSSTVQLHTLRMLPKPTNLPSPNHHLFSLCTMTERLIPLQSLIPSRQPVSNPMPTLF